MAEAEERLRRRRTRSRQRLPSPFQHPLAGKLVGAFAAGLAVFDLIWTISALHGSAMGYGAAGPGMTENDVRYAMGEPSRRGATAVWYYQLEGGIYRVDFGSSRLVERVSCQSTKADSDCPNTLGLRIGSGEEDIWYKLGSPDQQGYDGATKVMTYRSLGLTFYLQRFQIVGISLGRTPTSYSYLEPLVRVLVP